MTYYPAYNSQFHPKSLCSITDKFTLMISMYHSTQWRIFSSLKQFLPIENRNSEQRTQK